MVDDAEGATRTATVSVRGALSDHQAHVAARAVAGSLLVKCSLNGADPYWGRVVAELGAAGVAFELDRVEVRYGGIAVCTRGEGTPHDAAAVARHLSGRHVELGCDLGHRGGGGGRAVLRPRAGVPGREPDHVVTTDARTRPDDVASILIEALPYIRRFQGAVVVVKYGGAVLEGAGDPTAALASFAEDVALLRSVGLAPVVVHGGGPQIAELLGRLGRSSEFVDGHRVTDAETLDIARMVLVGKVNSELVAAINVHGALAVGVSGFDANLLRVGVRDGDLGFVGDVDAVDPTLLHGLLAQGLVPVVATMGSDTAGQAYNVNADAVAGALAAALGAAKLVVLTDVDGVRRDPDEPTSTVGLLCADELEAMVADGTASGGMAPKATACVAAVRAGVAAAHLLDGRVAHAVLLELFTDHGVGTMVTP